MPNLGIKDSLKLRGVRLTRQREILLDLIDNSGKHLQAEQLYRLAKERDPKINRVTVYRTLKMLKQSALVDELDLMHHEGDQHYYETKLKQEHAHIICLRCGKVEEFFGEPLAKLRRQVETHFGFQVLITRTEIGGYCSHCQALRAQEVLEARAHAEGALLAPKETLMAQAAMAEQQKAAGLVVINPSGNRARVALDPLPFTIGRQADNHLILRDNRASRNHARIVREDAGDYYLEDLKSRHGTWVNGTPIDGRRRLINGDRIEFGVQDSYRLIFTMEEGEIQRLLEQFSVAARPGGPAGSNLAKLRALVEVARTVQSSLSTNDVLAAVLDAAMTVTGTQRGFLLLRKGDDLEVTVGRDARGLSLAPADLQVPTRRISDALRERRELLSMNFDWRDQSPESSTEETALRGVVCVPLVHVRTGGSEETCMVSSVNDTVGMIYMESRGAAADLSIGDREILQTLAIEASTILENARLFEQERLKLKMDEELNIAREIQRSLLPRRLPASGWFRAAGSSLPSLQVGGDYYDVRQIRPDCWATVVADVSGKGVSSALLAGLLQGAFLAGSESEVDISRMMSRVNHFLLERTEGEKYATVFYCTIEPDGHLRWVNAGHCPPVLLRASGDTELLTASGMPVGMLEEAIFEVKDARLEPGDKLVAYTDGVSEAQNLKGEYFHARRVRELLAAHATSSSAMVNAALIEAVEIFTEGVLQADDLTIVVMEYQPDDV